jgi:hypothetical protein
MIGAFTIFIRMHLGEMELKFVEYIEGAQFGGQGKVFVNGNDETLICV